MLGAADRSSLPVDDEALGLPLDTPVDDTGVPVGRTAEPVDEEAGETGGFAVPVELELGATGLGGAIEPVDDAGLRIGMPLPVLLLLLVDALGVVLGATALPVELTIGGGATGG